MGYDTQKPEGLLERIISWATKPGDLVADFYCGSGTTPAVAQALDRRFIACDMGRTAVSVTRRRVLSNPERSVPLDVLSIRQHARQLWQGLMVQDKADADATYVLERFGAKHDRGRWGRKAEGAVWVAPVDAVVDASCIDKVVGELLALQEAPSQLDVVAWAWGPDDAAALRKRVLNDHGLTLRMWGCPDEVERGVKPRGGVAFRARPEIGVRLEQSEGGARVVLTDLNYPQADGLPKALCEDDVQWPSLIERWLVDWCHHGDGVVDPWMHHAAAGQPAEVSSGLRERHGTEPVLVKVSTVLGEEIERIV